MSKEKTDQKKKKRGGWKDGHESNIRIAQSPEDAELAKNAFAAQKSLRAKFVQLTPAPVVGLSLGKKGYTILVFVSDPSVAVPETYDGFPVEKRNSPAY